MSKFLIDSNWTLFLDRDGVINHEAHLSYINNWNEFKFYEGAKEAFKIFAAHFKYICIVTNQRGVAKGVTKIENLYSIHQKMTAEILEDGGRIDGIYFCADADLDSPDRKPNAGMATQAKKDFPAIDFSKSIMVGNNLSDMGFGRNIGAKTVFLTTTAPDTDPANECIDVMYGTLHQFALSL